MARSTLPALDPLAQLGIGGSPDVDEPTPRPPRPLFRDAPSQERTARPPVVDDPEPPQGAAADALEAPQSASVPAGRAMSRPVAPTPLRAATAPKVKFNARIPAGLAEAVRDCVVALYSAHGLTIDGFTAVALRRELERLKKQHNGGEDFSQRIHDPKPGRPMR
jgi:hypothetical protein